MKDEEKLREMKGICLKQEPVGEKLYSPLGCSCQGSREADIIHLIGSYCYIYKTKQQNFGGIFLFTGPKVERISSAASNKIFPLSTLLRSRIDLFTATFFSTQRIIYSQP